jgi:acyl-CoA synthetase (NDP forming)
MADACAAAGLEVPELDPATRARIDAHLPAYGTSQNPVDATAQAIRDVGHAALAEMVGASDRVDSVIVVTSARNPAMFAREHEALARVATETAKPILFCSYTIPGADSMTVLNEAGYVLFANMPNCARTVAEMAAYRAFRERFLKAPTIRATSPALEAALFGGDVLCEYEAKRVLAEFGLPIADERLAENADAAVAAATAIGYPVALKAQSPDIAHKTEAGAVALNIDGEAAVRAAHGALLAKARAHDPKAAIHGVLVQPMAPPGVEMILGIKRDETFGPLLMVGLGGVHVEILDDVAFAPVPLDAARARDLLDRLKGRRLLDGACGQPPADLDALCDLMATLSQFAAAHADTVAEIDLNPVIVHEHGLSIVDALITTRRAAA